MNSATAWELVFKKLQNDPKMLFTVATASKSCMHALQQVRLDTAWDAGLLVSAARLAPLAVKAIVNSSSQSAELLAAATESLLASSLSSTACQQLAATGLWKPTIGQMAGAARTGAAINTECIGAEVRGCIHKEQQVQAQLCCVSRGHPNIMSVDVCLASHVHVCRCRLALLALMDR